METVKQFGDKTEGEGCNFRQGVANIDLLVAAMEQTADAILITDTSARIQYVNPAFTLMTGYRADEIMGQSTRILKSNQQDPEYYRQLWETILSGRVWRGALFNRRKNGTLYPEEMAIAPVRDAAGTITNFIAVKQDVTDRRAAEESLQAREREVRKQLAEIEQIYKYAPVGLAFVDREFRVIRVNQNLAAMNALSVEQCIGKTIMELLPDISERVLEIYRQVFATGEPILDTELHSVFPGKCAERDLLCNYIPLKSETGEVTGVIESVLEITHRKRAEEGLRVSEKQYRQLFENNQAGLLRYSDPMISENSLKV